MSKLSPERQRELIEQYKKTPKQMGVYCIRNLQNDRRLVAATRDIRARFNRHRMELKTNAERLSPDLQRDWLSLGAENFAFEVLEELVPLDTPDYDPGDDLQELEELWLDKLKPYIPAGYNPE